VTLDRLYRFVQFEYPWSLGPADGRYLIRDHAGEDAHHVLVIRSWPTTVAGGRRGRRWGREREASSEPAEVALSRATLVDTAVVDDQAAKAWLEAAGGDAAAETLRDGLHWLNHTLRAHRAAVADPAVHEVAAEQALAIRAGFGEGVEVADGEWTAARDLPAAGREDETRRARREAALRPQERFAALLSGRDAVLACEELALRARWDLEHSRPREAAMTAHLALEAATAELRAFAGTRAVGARLPELEADRERLAAAANEALQGGPSEATMRAVQDGLARIEAVLRARSAEAAY
jgi:hypothetical protein